MGYTLKNGWEILPRKIKIRTFKKLDEKYHHVKLKWGILKIGWEILPRKIDMGTFIKWLEKYYHVKLKWRHLENDWKNITTYNWNRDF